MRLIELYIVDIDGTLTDGKIYYSCNGDELKAFNIKDGLAISAAKRAGFEFVVITGRESRIVEKRMQELGVTEIYQGIKNKLSFFEDYIQKKETKRERICYIGDDLNDLPIMKIVGYKACPADACEEVKRIADYVSSKNGGDGAVREIMEYYLKQQDEWERIVSFYL